MADDPRVVEQGSFDTGEFKDELDVAGSNGSLGTSLWFENDHTRVWEVRLGPGERGPFHAHTTNYFWTVVEPGRGLQRRADGSYIIRDYEVGDTMFLENSRHQPMIHDLENVGDTMLRFVTVEIL
jgi:hypothetical protein